MKIQQINVQRICRSHRTNAGRVFEDKDMLPMGICPFLYHSLYPYFLGLAYGAKFDYNEAGDVHACCPAANGVDCLVERRRNDGSYGVGKNVKTVVYARVVKVGSCPKNHEKGHLFVFPNVMKDDFGCPALLNNIFPFLNLEPPSCINKEKLRCPDWKDTIYAGVE